MQEFYEDHLFSLTKMKNVQMTFCLNDDAEILVRLKPKVPDKALTAFKKTLKKEIQAPSEFDG